VTSSDDLQATLLSLATCPTVSTHQRTGAFYLPAVTDCSQYNPSRTHTLDYSKLIHHIFHVCGP